MPPAEAEHLNKEAAAAIEAGNQQRHMLVYARPFYQANELRKSLSLFRINVASVMAANSTGVQAIGLVNSLGNLADLRSAFNSYIDFDQKRSPPVLKEGTVNSIWFQLPVSRLTLEDALRCAIGEMREP
ncbi:hypothetical protein OKC48_15950 [Methylorubrum extorquens]|uniref:hypothetical protein n=1 Tax=Methylorubrum extorquens TaxID=408 RepID=UPI002238CD30|nr:hypothetical protein [Methylorubrum extorquens]UYW24768.1 hypothetical protein OKC48_15950 [Methylorubrum extorquens]